jgi:hypothetical protein
VRTPLSIALLAAALVLSACGSSDPEATPLACLDGPNPYLTALETAPEQVSIDGSVAISDCLVRDQPAGQLNEVGAATTAAATELNAEALKRPRASATTQLGYLVGAVERGADDTNGVHADLVRRINAAARFSEDGAGPGAAFERTYGAGYAVGRESG